MASKWYEALYERGTIVYIDPEGTVAIWNNSLTTNWYDVDGEGNWYPVDCTTMGEEGTIEDAIQDAYERIAYWGSLGEEE